MPKQIKRVVLKFECGNAAFHDDGYQGRAEAARILRKAAELIENNGSDKFKLQDINGNSVGTLEVK